MFSILLAPRFVAAYNLLKGGHAISDVTLQAHMTVFPKEGKDPDQLSAYLITQCRPEHFPENLGHQAISLCPFSYAS